MNAIVQTEAPRLPSLQSGGAVRAIVPQDFDGAWRIATAVCKAGMAPKGLDTPEKAMVAIMHGMEVGLTPMAALQSIAVVNGRPTIWGDGAIVTVTLHQKRSLPLLKKYWAVLRDVVDNCKTPWNSADEASDAIKLALGVTDIGKTVKGQWFIRPGSISFNSMDQAAFRDFFDKAMAVLAHVTGIDPQELNKRYSHIADDEPQSSGTSPDEAGSGDAPPSASASGTDQPEPDSGDEGEPGALEAGHGDEAAPGSSVLLRECMDKFLEIATRTDIDDDGRRHATGVAIKAWKNELVGREEFVTKCVDAVGRIVKGESTAARERAYLEGLVR